ncbi:MAG TPA: hypothetical protein VMZ28_04280 [Kofleriaceae bacterium]|nr:hypothetical protein [Kofleriaceae bacterium]
MTNQRAASLSVLLVLSLAGGAARAGGPAREKPKSFVRAPRQYMRDYRAFKQKHDLKPLAGADYTGKVKPWKAFRQTRKTGVTPENLAFPHRMQLRMKQLGKRVKGIRATLDGVAGMSHRTDRMGIGDTVRAAMAQYSFAVSELEEADSFGAKHEVGDRAALREVAIKLRDAMKPQIEIMTRGQDHMPDRFAGDMWTAGIAGAAARDGYMMDRGNALRANRKLESYIATGSFDEAD